MKNKNLALVAVLFTISVIMAFANGPTPQVVIDTDQIIDGAVTILKTDGVAANDLSNVTPATGRAALGLGTISTVNSPVPVANGGTGKTTAAEALAALGGASLNGSGTADFMAQALLYNVVASGTLSTTDIATITIALPQSAKGGLWFVIVHVSGNNVYSFRTAMSAWIGNPYVSAGIQSMLGFDYTGGTAVTLIRVKNNREFGQYVSSGDANLLEVVIDASTIGTTCSYEIRLSPRF